MTIQALTKGTELQQQINRALEDAVLLHPDSPQVLGWMTEIDSLAKADPDDAKGLRALVLHLVGDLDGALAALDQCSAPQLRRRLVLLSNYCRALEVQKLYARYCGPDTGQFSSFLVFAKASGAFHQAAIFAKEAERIRLSNLKGLDLEGLYMIDEFLHAFGVSDADTGQVMETVGSVLVDHGLLFVGDGPDVEVLDVPGELRTVHLTYHLATSPAAAVDVYLDFITKLFEKKQTVPNGLHVSFEGMPA